MAQSDTDAAATADVAASGERGERSDQEAGKSVQKVDGRGLVTGEAPYTDDVPTENALEAVVLRSPHAHARIESIDTSDAEELDGVRAILTHEDVPDRRYTRAGFPYPQKAPFDELLLEDKVRFVGDPVALIAAETAEAGQQAKKAIDVAYEVLDHVLDPEAAMAADAPTIHDEPDYENPQSGADPERNVVCTMEDSRGDVEAGFEAADHVVEDTYETQIVQQAQMEMNTTVASIDGRDRLVLRTSTQIPHQVRDQISRAFDLPRRKVQVIKPKVGGGFGVKQDGVPSQYFAAALALETGETVRIENSRADDLHVAQTRHAATMRVKVGVKDDGTVTAMKLDTTLNAGAYGCHTPTVLSVSGHTPLSLYPTDNVEFTGRGVYTNITPGGAMRGYGAVQGNYAVESHIDEVARTIGMDPLEFRRQHSIDDGDAPFEADYGVPKTGPMENVGLPECIEKAADAVEWGSNRETDDDRFEHGYGMGICLMKSGVPGDEFAGAEITLENDGTFTLRVGVGDAGQGAETTVAQIAASVLGVPTADIHVKADDTDATPWDNGAYADSTTYVSGQAAERAARDAAADIRELSARWLDGDPTEFELADGDVVSPDSDRLSISEVASRAFERVDGPRARITGHGECNPNISPRPFVAHAAEVVVDTERGTFDLEKYAVAADCGFAINPENAKGQLYGGAAIGLGQALTEELVFDDDGTPAVGGLRDYQTLRSTDMPEEMEAILVETYEPTGPFGAKSIGEVGNTGPPGAVANAVADAVGVRIRDLPITDEKIRDALDPAG